MKSPLKRAAAGTLAAIAVFATVTVAQTPALAAPNPAPQQPTSDALAKYRELAGKAEKLNEDYLKAKDDLGAKQTELDKATGDVESAKQAGAKANADKAQFQKEVDKFAGASFTSGAQLNKLSALLSGSSTQDFLDRSSALEVISADKNKALANLTQAVQQALDAENLAVDAQKRATDAKNAAAQLTTDIEAQKKSLDDQIKELEKANSGLSAADKALQKDKGGPAPNVKAAGPAAQAAINAALSKLGSPYVWGATGPGTFDCSGLTSWAYKQAGIGIPRSSRSQSTNGTPISKDQLQPGDLVFYNSPVSHVGLYIGNGQMVHAPTTGDVVKISPLQSKYVGARRVA